MTTRVVTDKPVVVTGASGFIGSHVVAELLSRLYRVRAVVRGAPEEYPFLTELPGARQRLELVSADLTEDGAFYPIVRGAEYVLHTAIPRARDVKDLKEDLVAPAVKSTTGLMNACIVAGTVKRVVFVTSMDEPVLDEVYAEKHWNDGASLEWNPYDFAKKQADVEAWWVFGSDEEYIHFDLVTMHPCLVIGPSLSRDLRRGNRILVDILSGAYPWIMRLSWGFVDVRDVALAHVLAMESSEANLGYVCANETVTMRKIVEICKKQGYREGYELPKRDLACSVGDWIAKAGSYLQPTSVGAYLRRHIGKAPRFDHSKIERNLGIAFRPMEGTIVDTLADLERWGHIAPRKAS